MGKKGLVILCLQFADDTLIFGDASMQNILTLKSILRCYEMASGLRVNFFKSNITGLNMERRITQVFADMLNCKMMEIPFTYLGLPVGANPRSLNM